MTNEFCRGEDVCLDGVEVRLISHNPSVVFLVPVRMMLADLLCIFRSRFVKIATQSLSHICPIDTKDELLKSLNI